VTNYKTILIDDNVWPHHNRASFDQDKLVSYGDYQYGLYWSADETLVLFRRDLRNDSLQKLRLPYKLTINPKDGHRNTVVGISPEDGRLHLSWDHHNNDLRYTKSRTDFLTTPPDQIDIDDFEPAQPLTQGAPQKVTYPRFFNDGNDNLFFIYRTGKSGSGDSVLSRYDAGAAEWSLIATCLFSKEGVYGPWENSDSRNAYLHDVLFDANSRLHITWVYRETGASPASNHDLHYAWSDDCITWHNNAGDPIANIADDNPIALDDPGIVVSGIPVYHWLMNQCGMTLDVQNQPHVATFHMTAPWIPDPLVHDAPAEVYDRFRPYHYWRDLAGTWHTSGPILDPDREIAKWGRMRRPNIVADRNSNITVYYATDQGYRGHTTLASSGYAEWNHFAMTGDEFGATDAGKHDRRLLRDRGILSFTAEPQLQEGQTAFALVDITLQ
jgi:hypothetical protein